MKRKYRFIGMEACLYAYGVTLRSFGELIEMEEAHALDAMLGGGSGTGFAGACALLPEADFLAMFTPEDLKLYGSPVSHMSAPAAFLDKKKKALLRLHEIRQAMERPPEQSQPAPPQQSQPVPAQQVQPVKIAPAAQEKE